MSFAIRRTEPYVKAVNVRDLTKKDMEHLDNAIKEDYDGITRDELLDKAIAGFCQIWRLGKFEGIIVTEIIQRNGGLHLWAPQVAGIGFLKHLDEVEDYFLKYAKNNGCSKFRCAVIRKGLQRVYSKRWRQLAIVFERDI